MSAGDLRPLEGRALRDLFDEAGPVIRYRIARELLEDRALTRSCELFSLFVDAP